MRNIADVVFDGGIVVLDNANVVPVFRNVGLNNAIVALNGGIVKLCGGNVVLVRGVFSVYLGNYCVISGVLLQKGDKNFQIAWPVIGLFAGVGEGWPLESTTFKSAQPWKQKNARCKSGHPL